MSSIIDNELFGWNLIYEMNKSCIKTKYDVLVAFVHWTLIRKGFRCVGLGDDPDITPNLELTECLPDGWTQMRLYKIRYIYNFELYILASARDMGHFCINLMQPFDLGLTILYLDYDIIISTRGTLSELMPNYNAILREIQKTLINPFIKNYLERDATTQTTEIQLALERAPPELEPLFRVLKTTPMQRTMSKTTIDDVISKFQEAIISIRTPRMEEEDEEDDEEDTNDFETIRNSNSYHDDDHQDNNGGSQNFPPENGDCGHDDEPENEENDAMNDADDGNIQVQGTGLADAEAFDGDSPTGKKGRKIPKLDIFVDSMGNLGIEDAQQENKSTGVAAVKSRQELLDMLDPIDIKLMEAVKVLKVTISREVPQDVPLKCVGKIFIPNTQKIEAQTEASSDFCEFCNIFGGVCNLELKDDENQSPKAVEEDTNSESTETDSDQDTAAGNLPEMTNNTFGIIKLDEMNAEFDEGYRVTCLLLK